MFTLFLIASLRGTVRPKPYPTWDPKDASTSRCLFQYVHLNVRPDSSSYLNEDTALFSLVKRNSDFYKPSNRRSLWRGHYDLGSLRLCYRERVE